MQIVRDRLGIDFKRVHQVTERMLKELETDRIFEIAQVLALVGELAAREGKHIFEVAANRKQRRRIERQWDCEWNVSAGAADELGRSVHYGGNRVIAALKDFAVVHQESVGDVAQAGSGFLVVDGYRLFAEVGGGHDERPHSGIGEEKVLQRSIRQIDTEPGDAGRYRWCNAVVG